MGIAEIIMDVCDGVGFQNSNCWSQGEEPRRVNRQTGVLHDDVERSRRAKNTLAAMAEGDELRTCWLRCDVHKTHNENSSGTPAIAREIDDKYVY